MVSGSDWEPAKFRIIPQQPNVLGVTQDVFDDRLAELVVLRRVSER